MIYQLNPIPHKKEQNKMQKKQKNMVGLEILVS